MRFEQIRDGGILDWVRLRVVGCGTGMVAGSCRAQAGIHPEVMGKVRWLLEPPGGGGGISRWAPGQARGDIVGVGRWSRLWQLQSQSALKAGHEIHVGLLQEHGGDGDETVAAHGFEIG